MAELKQLCAAAGEKVCGAKAALVERLCQSDVASCYGQRTAETVASLKYQAEEVGLTKSGKRFDLILRLLQHKTGRGQRQKPTAKQAGPPQQL